ncbi:MAG: HAMP domain-containing histidine kinase [Spirochaetales bacterium]|nr:HAMP domain-containing histidine kinase [Spirochaetales bacterium]
MKKKYNIFKTVKFRITLLYIALFAFSFVFLFFFTYHLLNRNLIRGVDERLKLSLRRLEERYLVAGDNKFYAPFKNVPDNIILKASRIVDGLSLRFVKTEDLHQQKYYVFLGTTDRMIYEIWISLNGVLFKVNGVELSPEIEFLENEFENEAQYFGTDRIYFMMISPEGKILANSELDTWGKLKNTPFPNTLHGKAESYVLTLSYDKIKTRVLNHRLPDGNTLQAGIKMDEEERFLDYITVIFLGLLLITLILSSACSWFISHRAMAGIKRVAATANNIGKEELDSRVSVGNEGEEIRELVDSFNQMLIRIQTLIREMKEVSDNIAHDLRTPLTRIRGIIETTVNGRAEKDEYRQMCGEVLEECDRLVTIINTMLEISQMASGVTELNRENVNINELLEQACTLFSPVAEIKNITLDLQIPDDYPVFYGDKIRLQRMIANLIDNAIKYTPENGKVTLSLSLEDDWIFITVEDTGCGISAQDQELIFNRFYRCDNSRSLPGNGLGLSLALAIAKIHNGEIDLKSSLAKGTVVRVTLPLFTNN